MHCSRGIFVVLEGIDGTGKSTLVKTLAKRLGENKRTVHETFEPTATWLGDAVRRSWKENVDPRTEALLFVADRCEHTLKIEQWLQGGNWVISDRYRDSSCAYQGAYLSKEMGVARACEWVDHLHEGTALEPDLVIIIDAPPKITLARLEERDKLEKFEKQGYLETVRAVYLHLASKKGRHLVDGTRSLNDVADDCWSLMEKYL